MNQPTAPLIISPFAFDGKELQRLEIDGDIWYFAEDVRDLLGINNIHKVLPGIKDDWKRVIDAKTASVTFGYSRGNANKTLINTKAVIKIALRSRWNKADEFAEQIADIAERYYKGDLSLASEVIERNGGKDQAGLEQIAVQSVMFLEHPAAQHTARRIESVATRKAFISMLGKQGVSQIGFGRCTNEIYRGALGGKAKEVASRLGIAKNESIRDHLPQTELIGVTLAESLAADKIEVQKTYGDKPCADVCFETSSEVGKAIARARL